MRISCYDEGLCRADLVPVAVLLEGLVTHPALWLAPARDRLVLEQQRETTLRLAAQDVAADILRLRHGIEAAARS